MLEPDVAEERQSEIVARMRELVERGGGAWSSHDVWGRRKLAYEIDHTGEGVYHLVTFDAEPETLDELARILKITDGVMRHLAVRRVPNSRTDAPPPLRVTPPSGEQTAVPATGYASNTRSQGEE